MSISVRYIIYISDKRCREDAAGEMANLQGVFQEFNASKFVVFSSLLGFSLLFTLKLDRSIDWSWWSIFVPLWIWKGIASRALINTSI